VPAVFPAFAQTQQPFLFANTVARDSTAVVTFTRNDSTGALTVVAGSPFPLKTPYCFGRCGDGVSLYKRNTTTGAVAEVTNSPLAASAGGLRL
jgi:hypothetical protein